MPCNKLVDICMNIMVKLNGCVQDLGCMVAEQGEQITQIEKNTEIAKEYVKEGEENLHSVFRYLTNFIIFYPAYGIRHSLRA